MGHLDTPLNDGFIHSFVHSLVQLTHVLGPLQPTLCWFLLSSFSLLAAPSPSVSNLRIFLNKTFNNKN